MGTCLFKLFYVGIMESLNGDGRQFFNGCVSIIQQFVSQIIPSLTHDRSYIMHLVFVQ
jgi:hypothetical protein